jgi:23S rRNA (adenine2503-C2)-methyltransferase
LRVIVDIELRLAGFLAFSRFSVQLNCAPETKMHARQTLLGLNIEELTTILHSSGEPAYRARQLFEAVYAQRVLSAEAVSTLPAGLRSELERNYAVGVPEITSKFVSRDGTVRYLLAFADAETVETVWMPNGDGGEAGDGSEAAASEETARTRSRGTICISSQVGCAVDCKFCLTALLGVKRNLAAGEIVGQVVAILNDQQLEPGRDRINLVFMGMGEPFLNYENFIKAVRLLVEGVGIAESRMTVSTAGIIPRIHDFGQEPVRPKLAISLNASNQELRSRLMPITRKWTLEMLMAAAREFPLRARERLTFEYVLLNEVNDSAIDAQQVVELLRGVRAKVNLIALNPGPGIEFATPAETRVVVFQNVLVRAGIPTFLRRPRGLDIYAACGQLKRTVA